MKNFSEISGFDDELRRVGERAQEIAADALMREPLSEVLTAVFSAQGKMLRPSLLLLFGRMGENYPRCADDLVTAQHAGGRANSLPRHIRHVQRRARPVLRAIQHRY